MQDHTDLWKARDARNPKYQFGVEVEKSWFWYDNWLEEVRRHCQQEAAKAEKAAAAEAAKAAVVPAAKK
jgi:hypothetical protein